MTDTDAADVPTDGLPTPDGQYRPSLLERQQQLRATSGFRAMALIDRVKRMSYVFQGNVAEYMALVASLQAPEVSMSVMDVRHPEAHDQLLSEAERLLHNVLTAMSTRVDGQRAFMQRHLGDEAALTKEYRDRVASAFAGDSAAFLKGLRNYITHCQLPVAQTRETLGADSSAITFILPCKPLLQWEKWNKSTRIWIGSCGEAVSIVEVVASYAHTAGSFDEWLCNRIGLEYAADIARFLGEQEAYAREVTRVFDM